MDAYARALDAVAARQHPDGLWRDFSTPAGASSEWVSAFVAHHIRGASALQVLTQADVELCARQRADGGWGYRSIVPSDADSTAWALLCIGDRLPAPRRDAARRFLLCHWTTQSGGFSTYRKDSPIAAFVGRQSPAAVSGWTVPHGCVTASSIRALRAAKLPAAHRALASAVVHLRRSRQENGLWRSYWWNGAAYPTLQALQALKACGKASGETATCAALVCLQSKSGGWAWAYGAACDDGAFETALAALVLLTSSCRQFDAAIERAIKWLCDHQRVDGLWDARPILRIPPPGLSERELLGRCIASEPPGYKDRNGVFTAAVAVACLRLYALTAAGRADPGLRSLP